MTSALRDVSAHYAGGWTFTNSPGLYVHRGWVYLTGVAYNGDGPVTSDILTGLPPEWCPAIDIHLTIRADVTFTDDTRDPALILPLTYAATMHPDGTLSLDAPPPPQVSTTPDPATYFDVVDSTLTHDARYSAPMSLGLIIGDLRWPIELVTDSFATSSLAAYLGPDFSDIDSGYVAHTERVHLTGSVRVNANGASVLLASTPTDAAAGLDDGGDETLVGGLGFRVYPDGGALNEDDHIRAVAFPPALAWSSPPALGLSPSDFSSRNYIDGNFGGGGIYAPGVSIGTLFTGEHIDAGQYVCTYSGVMSNCNRPALLPLVTFNLEDLLANIEPAPDWFLLEVSYTVNLGRKCHLGVCPVNEVGCGALLDVGFSLDISGDEGVGIVDAAGLPVTVTDDGFPSAWVALDDPLYRIDPGLLDYPLSGLPGSVGGDISKLIIKAGQLTEITLNPFGKVNVADPSAFCSLWPLYERRAVGLRAGQVLHLDGSGWPGVLSGPGPPPPGIINTGSATAGIVPRA